MFHKYILYVVEHILYSELTSGIFIIKFSIELSMRFVTLLLKRKIIVISIVIVCKV